MRAIFGLVGLLGVLIAVIMFWNYAYLPHTQQVLKSGRSAQEQAQQMAGIDSNLTGRVSDHVRLEPVLSGGKLRGLLVKSIAVGSSYQTHYGLQANDVIDQIGPQMVRDFDDSEMATIMAYEAYQRQWELGVMRNNKHLTLPLPAGTLPPTVTTPPTPAAPTAQAPQAPTPQPSQQPPTQAPPQQPEPYQNPLYRQLNAIKNAGGQ